MGITKRIGSVALAVVLGITMVACGDDDDKGASADIDASLDTDGDLGFAGECAELAKVYAEAYASLGSILGGTEAENLEEAAEYFDKVAKALPKEIRADFAVFAEAYQKWAKAMAEADIDLTDPESIDSEQMAELQRLGEVLESEETQEAFDKVETYMEEKCGDG